MPFPFEKLEVYKLSLEWVELVENLTDFLKGRISYALSDQLWRASLSIPLNIAEGNGRWHKGEKRQFFWVARGSVFECVPIIQVLFRGKHITDDQYMEYYNRLEVLAKMLTNLVKSVEELNK